MSIHQPSPGGQGFFLSSVTWLANLVAVTIAFLGTPRFFAETITPIQHMTSMHYGNGYTETVAMAWFGISAGLIFCISRAVIGTALVFLRAAIATRFFH